jgi:hypothetical protein
MRWPRRTAATTPTEANPGLAAMQHKHTGPPRSRLRNHSTASTTARPHPHQATPSPVSGFARLRRSSNCSASTRPARQPIAWQSVHSPLPAGPASTKSSRRTNLQGFHTALQQRQRELASAGSDGSDNGRLRVYSLTGQADPPIEATERALILVGRVSPSTPTSNPDPAPHADHHITPPAHALAITLDRKPLALRSTRNCPRTAMHQGCVR